MLLYRPTGKERKRRYMQKCLSAANGSERPAKKLNENEAFQSAKAQCYHLSVERRSSGGRRRGGQQEKLEKHCEQGQQMVSSAVNITRQPMSQKWQRGHV
jgi:hypothetical protein